MSIHEFVYEKMVDKNVVRVISGRVRDQKIRFI